jgi:uncharacterized membrane protein YhfC
MAVSALTLTCLSVATLFVALLPIALYRRLRVPFALNPRDAIAGIAVFALCAMVIERALNGYVLHQNPITAAWLSNPFVFVVYGTLAAGVCEETGRYVAMRLIWRRLQTGAAAAAPARTPALADAPALAYGIGHGGTEAWLAGVLVQLQWIVFGVIENRGTLGADMASASPASVMRLHVILASLSPQTAGIFVLERVVALVFQIGFSVLVWRGVRAGWRGILPLAIVVHALVDVPAALFQAQVLPLAVADGLYALIAVAVAGVLVRLFARAAREAGAPHRTPC